MYKNPAVEQKKVPASSFLFCYLHVKHTHEDKVNEFVTYKQNVRNAFVRRDKPCAESVTESTNFYQSNVRSNACRIVLRTVRLCLTVERHGTACLRFDARKQYILRSMVDRTCMIGYMALCFFSVGMQRSAVDVYTAILLILSATACALW